MIDREISCLGPLGTVFKPAQFGDEIAGEMKAVGCGWVRGGKEIAVNFPLPMFLAKDEQFVVRFFRRRMGCEDLGLSSRSGEAIRQVAQLNNFSPT